MNKEAFPVLIQNGRQRAFKREEIISAAGSFAMWTAIAAFVERLPTLRVEQKRLKTFSDAELRYKAI